MNLCVKCGGEVQDANNLFFLTIEFLSFLKISLGSPNFKHQHIFPVTNGDKTCSGTPDIYRILNQDPNQIQEATNDTVRVRQEMWRKAYATLKNKQSY